LSPWSDVNRSIMWHQYLN